MCAKSLSHVQLFLTPWAVACQAPLSIGFSRQEYCSVLPFPASRDLPDPGIEPTSLVSPALAGRFFIIVPPGKPLQGQTAFLNQLSAAVTLYRMCSVGAFNK